MPRPPILCYVTDRHLLPKLDAQDVRENLLDKIAAAASAGVDWIQLREKDLSGRDCGTLALQALQRIANSTSKHAAPARLLVNDRLDVALAERAGGVHLGERSLPLAEAKRLTDSLANRKNFLIGVSCHSLDAARSAELDGADYIFFGPVFPRPQKPPTAHPRVCRLWPKFVPAFPSPSSPLAASLRRTLRAVSEPGPRASRRSACSSRRQTFLPSSWRSGPCLRNQRPISRRRSRICPA
jgi:thiamine-phosphate pyrophosphorylase